MKTLRKISIIGLLALAAAACTKEQTIGGGGQTESGQKVDFAILPTLGGGVSGSIDAPDDTRAQVNPTVLGVFPTGLQVGLSIFASAPANPLPSLYNNFYTSTNTVGTYNYFLGGINSGPLLSGFTNWNVISVYGYFPYNGAVTNIAAIPFSVATPSATPGEATTTDVLSQTDYMVAGTATKNMAAGTGIPVTLQFKHLMTAIELYVSRSNSSMNIPMQLAQVTYEITNTTGSRSFGVSGTYTAKNPNMTNMTGNIAAGATATKMTVSYAPPTTAAITNTGYRLLIIMPELRQNATAGNEDATLKLTFLFNDNNGNHYVFEDYPGDPSVSFTLSSVTNAVDATLNPAGDNGLLAGYTYRVVASIGTYTHFAAPKDGVPTPIVVDPDQSLPLDPVNTEPIDI